MMGMGRPSSSSSFFFFFFGMTSWLFGTMGIFLWGSRALASSSSSSSSWSSTLGLSSDGERRRRKRVSDEANSERRGKIGGLRKRRRRRSLSSSPYEDEDGKFSHKGDDDDDDDNVIVVEGTERPLFLCRESTSTCPILEQQKEILRNMRVVHPSAKLIGSSHKLINALFVQIDDEIKDDDDDDILLSIPGVRRISSHNTYEPQSLSVTSGHVQAAGVHDDLCLRGTGVKIAVLDTGIDYTHEALGGPGNEDAYDRAFGRYRTSERNRRRDGLFPTPRVYDGFDFLGERFDGSDRSAVPDDDPIDHKGHGTFVASIVASVAPDARLMALKVCSVDCPEFAVVRGIEYALDPNDDGNMDDAVDIINLSIGQKVFSSYHDTLSIALENAFALGVLSVVSYGNARNRPYIAGGIAISPNALSVGATRHPNDIFAHRMELYSSRGPTETHRLKPDLLAPSGSAAAVAGTGNSYKAKYGTSFSAPVVAGAAALIKQRCPRCSPFAVKALLMNNAFRRIRTSSPGVLAPLTLAGAGELRVRDALEAEYMAFSIDEGDVQPSISLGLVNAAEDLTVRRTVRVVNLGNATLSLLVKAEFRDERKRRSGALVVEAPTFPLRLSPCQPSLEFDLYFHVRADLAPSNHMDSSRNATRLDPNEFDGFVLIQTLNSRREIALPFHLILRKAAAVATSTNVLPNVSGYFETLLNVENVGADVAQIDTYELIHLGDDQPEAPRGEEHVNPDFRAIGYRLLRPQRANCSVLLEFAINLWERPPHLMPNFFTILLYNDEVTLLVRTQYDDFHTIEIAIERTLTGDASCSGMTIDHTPGSGNVIMRFCSEQLGISDSADVLYAYFSTYGIPSKRVGDITKRIKIGLTNTKLSTASLNVRPHGILRNLKVSGGGGTDRGTEDDEEERPLGLLMVTNAYRSLDSTGAATRETEALLLLREGLEMPSQVTDDVLVFPQANVTTGPRCESWKAAEYCPSGSMTTTTTTPTTTAAPTADAATLTEFPTITHTPSSVPVHQTRHPSCPPQEVPRAEVPTDDPTFPTSADPSRGPSVSPSEVPTAMPSEVPSRRPLPSGGPSSSSIPSVRPTIETIEADAPTSAADARIQFGLTMSMSISSSLLLLLSSSLSSCWW